MAGLRPKERNGVFYAVGSVSGKRIRTSLGTRSRTQATELCAQLEARLWKRHTYGEEAVRTFAEAAESYMKMGGEARYLDPLIRRFGNRVLGTIKPGELRSAAQAIKPNGKGSTKNRQVLIPARAIINHAATLGWCPPIKVVSFPANKPKRIAVGREWIDRFLAQADADGLHHLAAGVLLMWQTGVRVSEAARILPEHLDLSRRVVLIERTKTSTWEVRHLSLELVVRIANLPQEEGLPLFGYASRYGLGARMKAVCRRADLPWVPPHQAGRHSFATNALSMGATPKQVMEAGGWKSARMMLELYAHAEGAGAQIAGLFDTSRAQLGADLAQVSGRKGGNRE